MLACIEGFSQQAECSITLSGIVLDDSTRLPLEEVGVICIETQNGVWTDSTGLFRLAGLCPGKVTIAVTHIASITHRYVFNLTKDTTVILTNNYQETDLKEVEVISEKAKAKEIATISIDEIKGLDLLQTRGSSLGESLKEIAGVTSLQMGPTISKPVIDGLYGTRVLILNNDVRQEGQQWGSEHAPEIDPFIASDISVIKGAASIRYGADAIAGVILMAPAPMPELPGIGANVTLIASSNGGMGGLSAYLEGAFGKKLKGLSWRVQGTVKRSGNFRAAHYYLDNTGFLEDDFSASVQYRKKNFGANVYFSAFNTDLGIFSGADVGSVKGLLDAFARAVPISPSYFTYKFGRNDDKVNHYLLKANAFYKLQTAGKLEAVYSQQWDTRREYEIDPPIGTGTEPEVGFNIITNTFDAIYHHNQWHNISGSMGLNGITQGNVYQGLTSLIPNFRNYSGGAFWIEKYSVNKFVVEIGIRYDYLWERAFILDPNTLIESRPTHTYGNVSFTSGVSYAPVRGLSLNLNVGSAYRAPSISELYIMGVHFSDNAYDIGDSTLKSERSYNSTASVSYQNKWVKAKVEAYFNYIDNYIYERPTLTYVTLISGAYPIFQYTQTNAYFAGSNIDVTFNVWKGLSLESKAAVLRAYNITAKQYLVLAPADRWENTAKYQFAKLKKATNLYFTFSDIWVMRQNHVPPNSDYVSPPKGYVLLNAGLGCSLPLRKQKVDISLTVYNLATTSYRDYLNQFRYYADDLGINAVLRVSFTINYFKN